MKCPKKELSRFCGKRDALTNKVNVQVLYWIWCSKYKIVWYGDVENLVLKVKYQGSVGNVTFK